MRGFSVKDLKFELGNLKFTCDSFEIAQGEIVSVQAPSGFGKTSFLRALIGLQSIHHGELILNGRNLRGVPVHQRNFGVGFQDHLLFSHLNAIENALFGLKLRRAVDKKAMERAEASFELLGLEARAHAPVSELSGGEKQRVALLRAILFGPECLILDEPLKGLDVDSISKVTQFLKDEVSARPIPVIWISHQASDLHLGGRIIGQFQSRDPFSEKRHFEFNSGSP